MRRLSSPRRRPLGGAALAAGVAVGALALSACGTGATVTDTPSTIPPVPASLATSVQTPGGTWATVAMGHLDDPLNSFWQLFFRPAGSTSWSDQVKPTATATNGGLVLASSASHPLAVGILPSYDMKFTPIITTADSGTSWSTGLLDRKMAARPDALATGPGGAALSIATARGREEVFESAGGLSSWRALVSVASLSSGGSGQSCAPSSLTAVGYAETSPVVGTSCTKPGATGLFLDHDGRWGPVGPAASPPFAGHRAKVLALDPVPGGLAALVSVSGPGGTNLLVSWTTGGTSWTSSAPFPLSGHDRLVSYGPASGSGLFALLATPGGSKQLEAISGPGARWQQLADPPANTATVASSTSGGVEALAVNDTVLTVWTLALDRGWDQTQVIHVPIQFGSSNP